MSIVASSENSLRPDSHLDGKTESGKAEANQNSRKGRSKQAKCIAYYYCEFRLASAFLSRYELGLKLGIALSLLSRAHI